MRNPRDPNNQWCLTLPNHFLPEHEEEELGRHIDSYTLEKEDGDKGEKGRSKVKADDTTLKKRWRDETIKRLAQI